LLLAGGPESQWRLEYQERTGKALTPRAPIKAQQLQAGGEFADVDQTSERGLLSRVGHPEERENGLELHPRNFVCAKNRTPAQRCQRKVAESGMHGG
jgi:hypothetical protein